MSIKKNISLGFLLGLVIALFTSFSSLSLPVQAEIIGNVGSLKSAVTSGFTFKMDMKLGDTDPDVKELQRVLNADPDTLVAVEEAGSKGKETDYFDELTKAAVIKFQNKYKNVVLTLNNITVADGMVNKATRTRLNILLGELNTYDSVGTPDKQGVRPAVVAVATSSTTVTSNSSATSISICQFIEVLISANIVTSARAEQARKSFSCVSPQTGMTVCQFVDLLVNTNIITAVKARQARATMGCTATNTTIATNTNGQNYSPTYTYVPGSTATGYNYTYTPGVDGSMNFIGNGAKIDFQANGQSNALHLSAPQNVTFSWASTGFSTCIFKNVNRAAIDSQTLFVDASGSYSLTCTGVNGSLTNWIFITIDTADSTASTTDDIATTLATAQEEEGEVSFGGTMVSLLQCYDTDNLLIPKRYELSVLGYPWPGVRAIYDVTEVIAMAGTTIFGVAEDKEEECKIINPVASTLGFKQIGVIKKLIAF